MNFWVFTRMGGCISVMTGVYINVWVGLLVE